MGIGNIKLQCYLSEERNNFFFMNRTFKMYKFRGRKEKLGDNDLSN